MTFEAIVQEFVALQGRAIHLQVRAANGTHVFQMIDRINEAGLWENDRDLAFINFVAAEASVTFNRDELTGGAWETSEYGQGLCFRLADVDVRMTPL